jgi:hypothetical protein
MPSLDASTGCRIKPYLIKAAALRATAARRTLAGRAALGGPTRRGTAGAFAEVAIARTTLTSPASASGCGCALGCCRAASGPRSLALPAVRVGLPSNF